MRMRFKPYARPELAAWEHFIDHPADHAGHWKSLYASPGFPLRLELGCGKGGFIAGFSLLAPACNYLGIDIKSEMLVVAKRAIEKSRRQANTPMGNIKLTAMNIEQIGSFFTPADCIERIYINFCNPWYKSGHAKHRLTHPRQLIQYRDFLQEGAEIHFKTDDDLLFDDSLRYFSLCGFAVTYKTYDLHADGGMEPVMTEHEEMFTREGIKTKACIAVKRPAELDRDHFFKLRNI